MSKQYMIGFIIGRLIESATVVLTGRWIVKNTISATPSYIRLGLAALFLGFMVTVAFPRHADASWFCQTAASERQGNVINTCGIASDQDEQTARLKALDAAAAEFNRVCDQSTDCRSHAVHTEPQRTDCNATAGIWKCYRMVSYVIEIAQISVEHKIARDEETVKQKSHKIVGKIYKGMSKFELIKVFGMPTRVTDFTDTEEVYDFRGEMCQNKDCYVTIEDKKVKEFELFAVDYLRFE